MPSSRHSCALTILQTRQACEPLLPQLTVLLVPEKMRRRPAEWAPLLRGKTCGAVRAVASQLGGSSTGRARCDDKYADPAPLPPPRLAPFRPGDASLASPFNAAPLAPEPRTPCARRSRSVCAVAACVKKPPLR